MQLKNIFVLGGSGFVGSAVVAKLDAAGYSVTVLTRRLESAKHLILLPHVKVVECDVLDYHALNAALRGADAVINLIGILHQTRRIRFNTIHHQLPEQLARICVDLGVKRLLHMSALRAEQSAPSQYLQSKAAGEAAVMAQRDKVNVTVFKPSVIFGRHDQFVNLFASLIKLLPVIVLAKPQAKFQPVWVEDVATSFLNSLENKSTYGQVYELAGPNVYTLQTLMEIVMATLGEKRPIIGLNDALSYVQAFFMELLPVRLMSRDNVRSMALDSIAQLPMSATLGVQATSLEAVIPEYLADKTQRSAYDRHRSLAGRR
ncbi:MAG: complex I NDUFA9 subunit family protein [Betaproteobacteria bacterium HGW-Betaproteobacteria-22]|nr:MAG: complex I NDUFA9 subunit family protein [Betaproteobacteria bacterium HGW-Betaproteobacteria-22]